jgi:hypothetical protein
MKITVFWHMMLSFLGFYPEDGRSRFLQNTVIFLPDYIALDPRR